MCSIAYLLARRWTIFNRQVKNRIDSPAHAGDFFVDVLQTIQVKDLEKHIKMVSLVPQDMSFSEFKKFFSETKQHYFPVMDADGRLISIFSINDIRGVLFSDGIEHLVRMKDIGLPKNVIYACLAETIVLALEGRFEVFTIGRDTEWQKVKEIYQLGLKHGMKLAAISGVNGVFSDEDIAEVVRLARQARKTWTSGVVEKGKARPAKAPSKKKAPSRKKAAAAKTPAPRKKTPSKKRASKKAAGKKPVRKKTAGRSPSGKKTAGRKTASSKARKSSRKRAR